jgi:hypothetical protein
LGIWTTPVASELYVCEGDTLSGNGKEFATRKELNAMRDELAILSRRVSDLEELATSTVDVIANPQTSGSMMERIHAGFVARVRARDAVGKETGR